MNETSPENAAAWSRCSKCDSPVLLGSSHYCKDGKEVTAQDQLLDMIVDGFMPLSPWIEGTKK